MGKYILVQSYLTSLLQEVGKYILAQSYPTSLLQEGVNIFLLKLSPLVLISSIFQFPVNNSINTG